MRGLSLTQPWASAIAFGSKSIETRSWSTSYRGPLAIHASKGFIRDELLYYGSCWNWCGALWPLGTRMGDHRRLTELLPFGAIVAICDLVACRPSETFTVAELDTPRRPEDATSDAYNWTERQMGNFDVMRYGLVLANVRALPAPISCKGALGLWPVNDVLRAQIEAS